MLTTQQNTKKENPPPNKVDNGKKRGESPAQDIQERAGKKSVK